jgi:hypothetical protein
MNLSAIHRTVPLCRMSLFPIKDSSKLPCNSELLLSHWTQFLESLSVLSDSSLRTYPSRGHPPSPCNLPHDKGQKPSKTQLNSTNIYQNSSTGQRDTDPSQILAKIMEKLHTSPDTCQVYPNRPHRHRGRELAAENLCPRGVHIVSLLGKVREDSVLNLKLIFLFQCFSENHFFSLSLFLSRVSLAKELRADECAVWHSSCFFWKCYKQCFL